MTSTRHLDAFLTTSVDAMPGESEHRARLFHLDVDADREELALLVASGRVRSVHDHMRDQLVDLVRVRAPSERLEGASLEARIVEVVGAGRSLRQHGAWAHYPWSGRLVHVLPQSELFELRTSANRHKITADEQERLAGLRVGVVGLSVGRESALVLALEGIGGELRLADFDRIEHGNLNRLRAGLHEIGVNKAVSTARSIAETDPYLGVRVFSSGITEENIDAFFEEGGAIDLLVEECDSLDMKVRLREKARALRIPVIMETSDRGMVDVERFDLEPDRPLFHGLVGDIRTEDLRHMSTYDKIPLVMRIVGGRAISPRMSASLLDIETTLKTWPQLASSVALGSALNADVARRVALGRLTRSGRFYVDVEQIVSDDVASVPETPEAFETWTEPLEPKVEPVPTDPETPLRARIEALVAHACLAPSGGNSQPWRFVLRADGELDVRLAEGAGGTLLDYEGRASLVAVGAAIENLALAAAHAGLEPQLSVADEPARDRVASVQLTRATPRAELGELVGAIRSRVTNRRIGDATPLAPRERARLDRAAATHGGAVAWLEERARMTELAEVLAEGDRLRLLHPRLHREMLDELRFTSAEARRTRDGIDVPSMELTPTDRAVFEIVRDPTAMATVRELDVGRGLGRPTRAAVAGASALGVLHVSAEGQGTWVRGGRAMQRTWLEASALGLAFSPMSALLYLVMRAREGGDHLDDHTRRELLRLGRRLDELCPLGDARAPILIFRLSRAGSPTSRSLRRPVSEVLRVEQG